MKNRSLIAPMALGVLQAVFMFGLVNATAAQSPVLEIVGTGDGMDVLRALGKEFKEFQIEVPPSIGSGGGVAAVGSGKATLGRIARKLSAAEIAAGIIYRPFARLPSAFFANPSAEVKSLSTKQLLAVYAGQVANWKEVGGADLRIRIVRREDSDSTLTVLRNAMPGWKELVITEKSKTATTTQEAVEIVRDIPGTIGFGPFSKELENGVTVLKIDGRYPTDPEYPSSVELALVYMDSTATPAVKEFLKFVTTPKARRIIADLGSVPVTP